MKRQQQGFTLIELVIVIVILGILSAFALPRFADLGGDARASAINGAAGSMKSASSIVRSACVVDSSCSRSDDKKAGTNTVSLDGQSIDLQFGYAAATASGIQEAAQIQNSDFEISEEPFTVTFAGTAESNCQATYAAAVDSTDTPSITTDTGGC
jgi:MSHA pilin protein MshA